MRNLKKILALVLALVMSLSLMATAGAADFSDKDQISDKYSDAVTVLNGLEVFKGYDNGARFEPQGNITRAEVAAIIYRIATGDVTDTQKDIYSTWGLFTDVADGSWYAGYVNYCANAGYIKGRGNKIFDPNGKVTGYEALAMILRAIGYDKNNEFSGSNWQVNTASIAKQRGITNNITDTLLGQAATREVVAEILFQAILVPTVTFNTATLSYTTNATSLGKDVLDLDKVTGVVVANEYANVESDDTKVLDEGKTRMRVAAGDVRTLDYGTDLTQVGMSMNAYIQGSKVLLIGDSGLNNVWDNGVDGTADGQYVDGDVTAAGTFSSRFGMDKTADTDFYVNFEHNYEHKADRRIEISVTFRGATATEGTPGRGGETGFDSYITGNISKIAAASNSNYIVKATNTSTGALEVISPIANLDVADYQDSNGNYASGYNYPVTYTKVFRLDDIVSDDDLKVIRGIFGIADDGDRSLNIVGSVYVGSDSGSNSVSNSDKSDTMSYDAFKDEYIIDKDDQLWKSAKDGEWVKVIDNNNDGKAEYAFKTTFTMDKVVDTYTKSGTEYNRFYGLDLINSGAPVARYMNDVAVGDIVLHTTIDKQALIWKAEFVEDTAAKITDIYNRKVAVTTGSGDTYKQSEIDNTSRLDQFINQMSETVNYRMYLDAFGRVRAYEPVDGNKYALITELYWGNYRNGMYVLENTLTAEYKAGDDAHTERVVSNALNNPFILDAYDIPNASNRGWNTWTELHNFMTSNRLSGTPYIANRYNRDLNTSDRVNEADHIVLQPATQNLGFLTAAPSANAIFRNATTNVARYILNGDGTISLSTAAQANYNANGTVSNGYSVNYVNLNPVNVTAKQNVFTLVDADGTANSSAFSSNVEATANTEFYIVNTNNGQVEHFTGWSNLRAVSGVDAMYAVARKAAENNNIRQNYWVADVVVIESHSYQTVPDDLMLILGRDSLWNTVQSADRQANNGQSLLAISAKTGDVVRIAPTSLNWGAYSYGSGFYKAYGVNEQEDGLYTVADLKWVNPAEVLTEGSNSLNVSAFQLRAGTVEAVANLNNWILVDLGDGHSEQINYKGYALGVTTDAAGRISTANRIYGDNNSNNVLTNHKVIWVQNSSNEALVVIDVTYSYNNSHKDTRDSGLIKVLTDTQAALVQEQWDHANGLHDTSLRLLGMTVKGIPVAINGTKGTVTLTGGQAASTKPVAETKASSDAASTSVYLIRKDTNRTYIVGSDTRPLQNGDKLEVVVQNANTTVVYYVTVTVETIGTNGLLRSLAIKGTNVVLPDPGKDANGDANLSVTETLTANVSAANNAGNAFQVVAVPVDDRATVTVTIDGDPAPRTGYNYGTKGAVNNGTVIVVTVKSEDLQKTSTYTVTVSTKSYTGTITMVDDNRNITGFIYTNVAPGEKTIDIVKNGAYYLTSDTVSVTVNTNGVYRKIPANVSDNSVTFNMPENGSVLIEVASKSMTKITAADGFIPNTGVNKFGYAKPGTTITFTAQGVSAVTATINGNNYQQILGTETFNGSGNYVYSFTVPTTATTVDLAPAGFAPQP